jgi:hypothetical protein
VDGICSKNGFSSSASGESESFNPEPAATPATVHFNGIAAVDRERTLGKVNDRDRK